MRLVLIAALLASCAGAPPAELAEVPPELRSCPSKAVMPAPLAGVVSLARLKEHDTKVTDALGKSERLRLSCAGTVAKLNVWIEDQRHTINAGARSDQ